MVLFFTVTLAVSIVGMTTLLALKRYELNSGRVILGRARPAVGNFFHQGLSWFEYVLPGLMRVGARRFYITMRRVGQVWAARIVVRLEHWLEQALGHVRRTTAAPRAGRQSSAFLREVVEHKKKLQDDMPEKLPVIEE